MNGDGSRHRTDRFTIGSKDSSGNGRLPVRSLEEALWLLMGYTWIASWRCQSVFPVGYLTQEGRPSVSVG